MPAATTVARARIDFGARISPYTSAIKQVRSENRKLQSNFRRLQRQTRSLGGAQDALAGRFRALASIAGIGALARFGQQAVTNTAQLGKFAEATGVAVEALQEFRYAGDQFAGLAGRTVDLALQRATRRIGEAANGAGEAAPALREMGIALRDQEGNIRPVVAILDDVADFMASTTDQATRLRLAFKLFDSEGARFVRVLQNGSAALQEMRRRARETGAVLSEEVVQQALDLDARLTDLSATIRGGFTRTVLAAADNWQVLVGAGAAVASVFGTRLANALRSSAALQLKTARAGAAAAASQRHLATVTRATEAAEVARNRTRAAAGFARLAAIEQEIVAERRLSAAVAGRAAAIKRSTAAVRGFGVAARNAGRSFVAALGGPVGATLAALSVGIGLWSAFGRGAGDAARDVRTSTAAIAEELDRIAEAQRRAAGGAGFDRAEAEARAQERLNELIARRAELQERLERVQEGPSGFLRGFAIAGGAAVDSTAQLEEELEDVNGQIEQLNAGLANVETTAGAATAALEKVAAVRIAPEFDLQPARESAQEFIDSLRQDLANEARDQGIELAVTGLGAGDAARLRTVFETQAQFQDRVVSLTARLAAERRKAASAAELQARAEEALANATEETRASLQANANAARTAREAADNRVAATETEIAETRNLKGEVDELAVSYGNLAGAAAAATEKQETNAKTVQTLSADMKAANELAASGIRSFEDALVSLTQGTRFRVSDFINGLIADVTRLIIRLKVTGPLLAAVQRLLSRNQSGAGAAAATAQAPAQPAQQQPPAGQQQQAAGATAAQACAGCVQAQAPFFQKLTGTFKGLFGGLFGRLGGVFRGLFGGFFGRLTGLFSNLISSMLGIFSSQAAGRGLSFAGLFHTGQRTVPGPRGRPQSALVLGGQEVRNPGSAGVTRVDLRIVSNGTPQQVESARAREQLGRLMIEAAVSDVQQGGALYQQMRLSLAGG